MKLAIATLSDAEKQVLQALAAGSTLKTHRTMEGDKLSKLHALDGEHVAISRKTLEALKRRKLIHSNKKFPAATYLLTDKGHKLALALQQSSTSPLTARNYLSKKSNW